MKKLLNIGVSALNDETLNRKIRISNLISLITIAFMSFFSPLSLIYEVHLIASLNITFLLLSVLNFYFHASGRHSLSFLASCFFGLIYFTAGTLIYGLSSNMHFFLVIMCMIAIVLFDDALFLKVYNSIAIALFFFLILYMKDREGMAELVGDMKQIQATVNITNVFSIFFIIIVFLLFFKRDTTLFQKTILEQKKLLQEKQKEIIDSITYAKRIQEAILPPQQYWKKNLPDSFILYRPKDIVAGDFYWMEHRADTDHVYFAAADCTGHGVPGALVSVVCNNALNRSLLEFGWSDTGKILDKTRALVIETFEKSGQDVKDGMDISLCRLNPRSNMLQWSGANNPLWLLRNGVLSELKPDKQPIGSYTDLKPFTTHTLQLEQGDTLYLFTDGYADQFGGAKGKKFKYKQLQEELMRMQNTTLDEQKEKLETLFVNWKNQLEQVDDVCIIGVRI